MAAKREPKRPPKVVTITTSAAGKVTEKTSSRPERVTKLRDAMARGEINSRLRARAAKVRP